MARTHHVSPHQTVLWAHHELTAAWAPSGILAPDTTAHRQGEAGGAPATTTAEQGCAGAEPRNDHGTRRGIDHHSDPWFGRLRAGDQGPDTASPWSPRSSATPDQRSCVAGAVPDSPPRTSAEPVETRTRADVVCHREGPRCTGLAILGWGPFGDRTYARPRTMVLA